VLTPHSHSSPLIRQHTHSLYSDFIPRERRGKTGEKKHIYDLSRKFLLGREFLFFYKKKGRKKNIDYLSRGFLLGREFLGQIRLEFVIIEIPVAEALHPV
jgi:hypothetical protein